MKNVHSALNLYVTSKKPLILIRASFFRAALDQERHRVLETDSKGNLYLYKSALLCKSEIIKRLTEDNFRVVKPSATEGKVHTEFSVNIMAN